MQRTSASEVARQLIRHGVEVEARPRRARSHYLMSGHVEDVRTRRDRGEVGAEMCREVYKMDNLDADEIDERRSGSRRTGREARVRSTGTRGACAARLSRRTRGDYQRS